MAARVTKPKPTRQTTAKTPTKAGANSKKVATKGKPKAKAAPKALAKSKAKAAPKALAKSKSKAKSKAAPKALAKSKAAPKALAKSKAKASPKTKVAPKPLAPAKPALAVKPQAEAKPASSNKASKSSAAREALKALAMKKVIAEVITPVESGSAVVDAYMRDVDHPFKAEMEAVRRIILRASSKVAERIKWNAPSFYYKEDLGAFHPRATEYAHLILLFPDGSGIPAKSTLLEGKQKERREAKFYSLADIETKRPALEKLVRDWVALRDA